MILVDTSAWIEYDRATGSAVDLRVSELIATDGPIAADGPIAVTEPVVTEVLAGARSVDRQADLRRLLPRFHLDRFDVGADFDDATHIYRRCRRAGITPRAMTDGMIVSVAWRRGAILLAHDADPERVASVVGIEGDEASYCSQQMPRRQW